MARKLKTLRWFDIGVVTATMFGGPILNSTMSLLQGDATPAVDFTSENNLGAGLQQAGLLAAGLGYLAARRFDFSQWTLKPTWKGTAQGAGIFLAVGAGFDAYYLLLQQFMDLGGGDGARTPIDATLLGYSALNATYEELFFLGICLASRHRIRALLYSLAVRFSFHTYMGLPTAAGIGLGAGLAYYLAYRRLGSLYPLIIAHALADIFGSSALGLLYW